MMATVHFYEKPGCSNNTRQKALLIAAGHNLIVYNLLTHNWASKPEKLRSFFGTLPVPEWFNRSAPAIKNGRVIPEKLSASQAIALMIADPLLIRRPLLEVAGQRQAGFEPEKIAGWLALKAGFASGDWETCPKQNHAKDCLL